MVVISVANNPSEQLLRKWRISLDAAVYASFFATARTRWDLLSLVYGSGFLE